MKHLLFLLLLVPAGLAAQNPTVRFATNQGNIDVELLRDVAPRTVQNFLNYMNRGAYNASFFHRSVRGFVIQGGGFKWANGVAEIPSDPPIRNEYGTSNTRGTIAMAKLGSGPDTATNQWFFNLADNSSNLNNQNGGFTVFGRVTDSAGLAVIDRIAAIGIFNAGSPFDAIPLVNYSSGSILERNLILVTSITMLNALSISSGGLITASAFGGSPSAAPGSFIEIYGSNLAGATRGWGTSDFQSGNAPTTLENVSVTVGGVPAFVNYVSPGQVNVQVPAGVSPGQAEVVVTNRGQSTTAATLLVRALAPGILAPASFKAPNGAQFVVALRPNGTFVANGLIAGLPEAPGLPGETLIFYGTGFGAVRESSVAIAGKVAEGVSTLVANVEFKFGDKVGRVNYAGLAPGLVGVNQFNIVVPEDVGTGDLPLAISVNGTPIEQGLYITIRP